MAKVSVVLGITGGIATGKSTATRYFEKKGVPIIDADKGARIVVSPDSPGLKKIVQTFGKEMLNEEGALNRKKLGAIVFSDPEKREQLNQILRKDIRDWIEKQLEEIQSNNPPFIVLDIPLLFEEKYEDLCDVVLVVSTSDQIQKNRLMERDGVTEEEARNRIESQWPLSKKRACGDLVIENSTSISSFEKELEKVWITYSSIMDRDKR